MERVLFRVGMLGTHSCYQRTNIYNEAARMLVEPQNITVLDIYGWAVKRCGAGKNGPFILLCAESFLMMFIPSLSWQIMVSYKLTTQNSRVLHGQMQCARL